MSAKRSLGEILDLCLEGKAATSDEMRYALVVMSHLATLERTSFWRPCCESPAKKLRIEEAFSRRKRAYEADPKTWLGKDFDPARPAVQERRRESIRLVERLARANA